MAMRTKENQHGTIYSNKDLRGLILPLVMEQLLAILVGMLDTVMISGVGEAAVSGVSLVDNINILVINIFAAMATGGAVVAGTEKTRAGGQICVADDAFPALFFFGNNGPAYGCAQGNSSCHIRAGGRGGNDKRSHLSDCYRAFHLPAGALQWLRRAFPRHG